jgi:D-lactate dehydrogenase (cytochrome)
MEFHGSEAGVAEQAAVVQAVADDHGGDAFEWATTPEARTRLWAARHHAYFAGLQMRPGCRAVTTDTCVPISRLAENINASIAEVEAAGLPYFIVGHVGDGNFHMAYLLDPARPEELATAERLSAQMVARALALEGTCTGEHGIGLHKQRFLLDETGAPAVAMMRALKLAMDPMGILNPGKVFSV